MTPFVTRVGSSAPQQNNRTEQKKAKNSEQTQSTFDDHRQTAMAEQVLSGVCSSHQITSDHTFHQGFYTP
jgi:5-enolpyruvylshikimate-3-phosphate synthase